MIIYNRTSLKAEVNLRNLGSLFCNFTLLQSVLIVSNFVYPCLFLFFYFFCVSFEFVYSFRRFRLLLWYLVYSATSSFALNSHYLVPLMTPSVLVTYFFEDWSVRFNWFADNRMNGRAMANQRLEMVFCRDTSPSSTILRSNFRI